MERIPDFATQPPRTSSDSRTVAPPVPRVLPPSFERERDLLAFMLLTEGRRHGYRGMLPIAHVVMNRAQLQGRSVEDVLTQGGQFSGLNPAGANRPNYDASLQEMHANSPVWREALRAARDAILRPRGMGSEADAALGATHYFNPDQIVDPG